MDRLFASCLLQLQMILFIGIGVIRTAEDENARVISIVEQFEDDTLWEFHSKSVRRAQVSKKTWDEYLKYKEQTCRLEVEKDAESKARGYLNWEEMTFHKSLRAKLLPGLITDDALSYKDAVMLSNVDGRLLSPEPESLCKIGIIDDSDQIEIAEKSRFEDTLISRCVALRLKFKIAKVGFVPNIKKTFQNRFKSDILEAFVGFYKF